MERIELTIYPKQAEEIENVLSEFQVPYVKTAAESYGIQVLFYIITVPSQMYSNLIEILETKVDTKDKINNIAQYNTACIQLLNIIAIVIPTPHVNNCASKPKISKLYRCL